MGIPARMGWYISPNTEIVEITNNEIKEISDIANNENKTMKIPRIC